MMVIVYILFGLVLGAVPMWVVLHQQKISARERIQMADQQTKNMQEQYEQRLAEAQKKQAETEQRHAAENERQRQQMDDWRREQENREQQQAEQMQQQLALMREQMNTTSERILKERAQELSQVNREQLSVILTPLQENLRQMRAESEQMRRDHTVSLERLDASIRSNWEREKAMGAQTERLAQALTGENKVQGDFGELRLHQILEDMGLEEGLQFEEQTTMRDDQGNSVQDAAGHRLIPDVVLHFPDQRDVVIDSKMSFTAFVDYQNAQNDEERSEALRRHLQSMRAHVKELAQKQYYRYTRAGAKLDFVLMYVFQESALQLALLNDATLWKDAYDQGVVISGSQNLYMTLRVLELTWKQVKQVENQENIMKCANSIVERVQNFADRFAHVDDMLTKTRRAFDDLSRVTADSGQSITTAARNLLKFGAQENRKKNPLPDSESLIADKTE
ncbi:MAG: DNA recombination protein RmuC [Bacteroidaceae bacterium]|nr:DNA recombination protein RmuC [Bacteroidaceae bacterium]